MTDSPALHEPLDPKEQPILEDLLSLRAKLSLLRQDKTTYIKSQDVLPLYEQVIEQVHLLNDIRADKRGEQNRVDRVLDDCFQLISLSFLTVGRNNEAPAVYAHTSAIKRLLDHLLEVSYYSAKDLESIEQTLEHIDEIIDRGQESYSPHLLTLLRARVQTCRDLVARLHRGISCLSPRMVPLHEKLVSMLRSIAAANTRHQFPADEVESFKKQLIEIQNSRKDGKFVETDTDNDSDSGVEIKRVNDGGQAIVAELLERCLKWADIVLERKGEIDEAFRPKYDRLRAIRNQLEALSLVKAWSLRETDLFSYQRELDRFDESRIDGNFVDEKGNPADLYHQRTLLYLIRRSYAWIYVLLISSEPVSEALVPVYNQLQTLRRCLMEVKHSGGVSSARELYPYSMKLNSIDNIRIDGKFMVNNDIPEGQAAANELLAECYEILHQLRVQKEEDDTDASDDEEEDDDDDDDNDNESEQGIVI
ncbi:MAG: hypothetical protein M1816_004733 [Peltula sp. TS41687]|nr:MAG: hypothetical protein M1816_004733 [Peltula sp. TS41687]